MSGLVRRSRYKKAKLIKTERLSERILPFLELNRVKRKPEERIQFFRRCGESGAKLIVIISKTSFFAIIFRVLFHLCFSYCYIHLLISCYFPAHFLTGIFSY